MEIEGNESTLKRRSYRSCISSAYTYVKDNAWSITKQNWKIFILIAALQALVSSWALYLSPGVNYVGFDFKATSLALCFILALLSSTLLTAAVFRIINKRTFLWNIKRSLFVLIATIIFTLVCGIVLFAAIMTYILSSKAPQDIPVWHLALITLAWLPIYIILCVPNGFVFTKYMVEPEMKLRKAFLSAYGCGLRSWGFIFITLFLTILCAFLINLIVCIPDHLVDLIKNISAYGTSAYGDPSGLPSYFPVLKFATSFLAHGVGIYLSIFGTYVLYNIYQTVTLKANDRKTRKAKKQIQ